MSPKFKTLLKVVGVVAFLYVFFVSIQLMGDSFKTWKAFSESLIEQAQNPFVGLFIGLLATSIIQSSSTTTSMVVGFVASGTLPVPIAIPIIMGANIGTSVTNLIVSMGHIGRRDEFQRAMACATIHDVFNLISVGLLLPAELATRRAFDVGLIEWLSTRTAHLLEGAGGLEFVSPLKAITKPASHFVQDHLEVLLRGETLVAIGGLVVSAVLLFIALYAIVKLMRSMVLERIELFFDKYVGANALLAMGMGAAITVMVQSSSITTSMIVPMAGAGILTLRHAFPITLGANVGTTITALLASLAAGGTPEQAEAALAIALAHLYFNLFGILIVYPVAPIREIPLRLCRHLGATFAKRRWMAIVYVLLVFFVIPGILVLIYRFL